METKTIEQKSIYYEFYQLDDNKKIIFFNKLPVVHKNKLLFELIDNLKFDIVKLVIVGATTTYTTVSADGENILNYDINFILSYNSLEIALSNESQIGEHIMGNLIIPQFRERFENFTEQQKNKVLIYLIKTNKAETITLLRHLKLLNLLITIKLLRLALSIGNKKTSELILGEALSERSISQKEIFDVIFNTEYFDKITLSDRKRIFESYLLNSKLFEIVKLILVNANKFNPKFVPHPNSIILAKSINVNAPKDVIGLLEKTKMEYSPENYKMSLNFSDRSRDRKLNKLKDNIDISNFKHFFCDLEVFNYIQLISSDIFLSGINYTNIHKIYISYLIRNLNLQDFVILYHTYYSERVLGNKGGSVYQKDKKKFIFSDGLFDFDLLGGENVKDVKDVSKDEIIWQSIQYSTSEAEHLINPHFNTIIDHMSIYEKPNGPYVIFVEPTFLKNIIHNSKEFNIIYVRINYIEGNHFTFITVDNKSKIVEFYDPHGQQNLFAKQLLDKNLKILFPGYRNNILQDYSGDDMLIGIQSYEENELNDGFCVIWGQIMIHLKLLNRDMSIKNIEKSFIAYCKNKNYSPYEVMLNYAEYIKRVVPYKANDMKSEKKVYDLFSLFKVNY
jgi:hypothetical protein